MNEITQQELIRLFHYEPLTGRLTNRVARACAVAGEDAGTIVITHSGKSYRLVRVHGSNIFSHRIAWMMRTGEWPIQIDHEDGDGLNNKWDNLRNVSNLANHKNRRKPRQNTSGYVGVVLCKRAKKWKAQIQVNGKGISLGRFSEIADAIAARKSAELLYGYHANHGSVRPL